MMTGVQSVSGVEWRKGAVARAVHSNRMEGLELDDAARQDVEDFVAGRLDLDEVRERVRRRHGLS